MGTTIYIGIYLVGCVLAYLVMKKALRIDYPKWTKKHRGITMAFSLFSWLTVISAIALIAVIHIQSEDFNEDAKW